jgi:hypothetical protein
VTGVLAGAAAVPAGLAGWHLAVRRWPYALAAGLAWLALSWWRKLLLALAGTVAGAMAGLAWELAPAAALSAAVILAGSAAITRVIRAAVARREGHQ